VTDRVRYPRTENFNTEIKYAGEDPAQECCVARVSWRPNLLRANDFIVGPEVDLRSLVCPALFAGLVLLASCGGEAGRDGPAARTAEATGEPPFEGTMGIVDRPRPDAPIATLVGVRTGRYPGFDRVVFEFEGDGLPGYRIERSREAPRQCGSGEVVRVAGEAWLQVRFSPAQAHDEEGRPTVTARSQVSGLPALRALRLTCDFEGEVTWVLGLAAPEPFRVFELAAPSRVVVDVRY